MSSERESLRVKHARRGRAAVVELDGVLDETFDRQRVLRGVASDSEIIFDLQKLTKTTSFGVRQWRMMLASLTGKYWFVNCQPAFIYQANMVDDYLGTGQVLSFYIPYACTECMATTSVLFDLQESRLDANDAAPDPGRRCSECKGELAFDDEPSSYFAFLSLQGAVPLSASAKDVLEDRPTTGDILVDVNVFGPFALLTRLAYGGVGEVWLARDQRTNSDVVLKIPLPHSRQERSAAIRFDQEAMILSRIQHENVILLLDHGRIANCPYLALEFVEGSTLARVIEACRAKKRAMPIGVACTIVQAIARGLQAVHAASVVHGDLSPDNVLVSVDGAVKVSDFGSATNAQMRKRGASSMAEGKTPYLAPEYVSTNVTAVDHRSDIFSAGVILYECLALRHPFGGDNELDRLRMLPDKVARPIEKIRRDVPDELRMLIERTLGPSDRRPHSAMMLANALAPFSSRDDVRAFLRFVLA